MMFGVLMLMMTPMNDPTSTMGSIRITMFKSTTVASLNGCLASSYKMNLARLPKVMRMLVRAIASLVENPNSAIVTGIMTPPPPIPPTFASTVSNVKTTSPIHSLRSIGKRALCSHIWSTQTLYGASMHFLESSHLS